MSTMILVTRRETTRKTSAKQPVPAKPAEESQERAPRWQIERAFEQR